MKNSYTQVEEDIWQCDDCGAFAPTKEAIDHYKSCKPGECEYWAGVYSEENNV